MGYVCEERSHGTDNGVWSTGISDTAVAAVTVLHQRSHEFMKRVYFRPRGGMGPKYKQAEARIYS